MKKYILAFIFGMMILPFTATFAETDTDLENQEQEIETEAAEIAEMESKLAERKVKLAERRTVLKELRSEWSSLDEEERMGKIKEFFPEKKYEIGERRKVGAREALQKMLERRKTEKDEEKEALRPRGFSTLRLSFDKSRSRLTRNVSNSESIINDNEGSDGLEERVRKARFRRYHRKVSRYGRKAENFESDSE